MRKPPASTFAIGRAAAIEKSAAWELLRSPADIAPKLRAAMAMATMSQPIRKRGAFTAINSDQDEAIGFEGLRAKTEPD